MKGQDALPGKRRAGTHVVSGAQEPRTLADCRLDQEQGGERVPPLLYEGEPRTERAIGRVGAFAEFTQNHRVLGRRETPEDPAVPGAGTACGGRAADADRAVARSEDAVPIESPAAFGQRAAEPSAFNQLRSALFVVPGDVIGQRVAGLTIDGDAAAALLTMVREQCRTAPRQERAAAPVGRSVDSGNGQ